MKERIKKIKVKIFIIIGILALALGAVLAGVIAYNRKESENEPATDNTVAYEYDYYQCKDKEYLDNADDVGVMIADFDSAESFKTYSGMTFVSRTNKYVQGSGSAEVSNLRYVKNPQGTFEPIDLSDYEEGSIHISVYVNNPEYLGNVLRVELTSSGKFDKEELGWAVSTRALKAGWNDLYLGIQDAKRVGEVDLSAINFFRVFCLDTEICADIYIDALYATDTQGMEYRTMRVAADGLISACDTTSDFFDVTGKITSENGEYKEGTGAIKSTYSKGMAMWKATLCDYFDISQYAEGGITFWLYVDDVSQIPRGARFEIRSSEQYDTNEYEWRLSNLETGWNEIRLQFKDADVAGKPDLSRICAMRIYTSVTEEVSLIVDEIRAVKDASEGVPEGTTNDGEVDGMIFSGDSLNYVKLLSTGKSEITRKDGEYVQGTGAYKSMGSGQVRMTIQLHDAKDISAYEDGGVQFSLYVKDKSVIGATALMIELTSAGIYDEEELMWILPLASLDDGWNTVKLPFASATATGTIDYTQVDYMRVFFVGGNSTSEDIVLIFDNIHAVHSEDVKEAVPEGTTDDSATEGMIFSGDSLNYVKLLSTGKSEITRKDGEYIQGTGAYKSIGSGQVRMTIQLHGAKDISAYEDGGVQFSLYIKDKSVIGATALMIELTSAGIYDEEELMWTLPLASLDDGWNTVKLPFASAIATGTIDYTQVDYMRVFFVGGNSTSEDIVLIFDNIHAIHSEELKETVPEGTTNDSEAEGMIFSGDSLNYASLTFTGSYEITREDTEYIQGTGACAYTGMGAGLNKIEVHLHDAKDISAYQDGGIEISLYIEDKSLFKSKDIFVELTSSGSYDKEELEWAIPVSNLKNGWNTVELPFTSATARGTIDYTQVDYMRIYFAANAMSEDLVMIMDDVHAYLPDNDTDDGTEEDNKNDKELNSEETDEHSDKKWSPFI